MIMMTQRSYGDVQIFTSHNLPQSLGAQMKSVRSDKSIKRFRGNISGRAGMLQLEHISVGCIALSVFSLKIQELTIRNISRKIQRNIFSEGFGCYST